MMLITFGIHLYEIWGQFPSLLLKIEGGWWEIVLPPFLALNLRKKNLFMPGLVGKHKMDKLERICSDWARKSL
jgi:hypothetical protein